MSSEIKVDTISENTSANGVVIDSVTLKDGGITTTGAVGIGTSSPASDAGLTVSSSDTGTAIFLERSGSGKFDSAIQNNGGSLLFKGGSNQTTVASLTEFMRIDSVGHITKPLQSAFLAVISSTQSNIANGNSIAFGTEIYDQNADFATPTFTAPVTGKYQFNFCVSVTELDFNATLSRVFLNTSNRSFGFDIVSEQHFDDADPSFATFQGSMLMDMDANDTASLTWGQSAGSAQADVFDSTFFSGFLAC